VFLGHIAVGFAAKRVAPRVSLGLLVAAPLFLDLLWPVFLAAGIERVRIAPGSTAFTPLVFEHYPWSHSLLMALLWGGAVGVGYALLRRDRPGGLVLGAGVVSHWVFDWISHGPDLPLAPGTAARYGLGLWNSVPGTIVVEGMLFVLGLWLYVTGTRIVNRWILVAFVAFLAVTYVANLVGPPPPSVRALTGVAFALWLLPVWAWWADRGRAPRV
jgi:hypothetical protein